MSEPIDLHCYMFVKPDFKPDGGEAWSRFEVDPALDELQIAIDGFDGPVTRIGQRTYDAWRHTLVDQLHDIMLRHPAHLETCINRLWTPERTMLVRMRVAQLVLGPLPSKDATTPV